MRFSYLQVFKSPKTGKFRVMIVGQPGYHIMNWRGCNYRRMTLPTQYKKTFNNPEDALAYEKELAKIEDVLRKFAGNMGDGTWFPDDEMYLDKMR